MGKIQQSTFRMSEVSINIVHAMKPGYLVIIMLLKRLYTTHIKVTLCKDNDVGEMWKPGLNQISTGMS